MEKQEFLNEERYQNTKRKISKIGLIVLIIGLCISGLLLYNGIVGFGSSKVGDLQKKLEERRTELEARGIKYSAFTKYTDGEEYELYIITKALDPSFPNCEFSEFKDNPITKEYCSAKNSTSEFSKTSSIMLGVFVLIATGMISSFIFIASKRREIMAYNMQQVMPVAQEGLEKMAPTVGKVAKEVGKEMAPVYGEMAREISKGIKEGLKDEKDK